MTYPYNPKMVIIITILILILYVLLLSATVYFNHVRDEPTFTKKTTPIWIILLVACLLMFATWMDFFDMGQFVITFRSMSTNIFELISLMAFLYLNRQLQKSLKINT